MFDPEKTINTILGKENRKLKQDKIIFNEKFLVETTEDLWLEFKHPQGSSKWVIYKPKLDNGFIKRGTILQYDHMFKKLVNFKELTNISDKGGHGPEFHISEIENFLQKGIMKELK